MSKINVIERIDCAIWGGSVLPVIWADELIDEAEAAALVDEVGAAALARGGRLVRDEYGDVYLVDETMQSVADGA